jgi:tRNA-modifying protein YgfZ
MKEKFTIIGTQNWGLLELTGIDRQRFLHNQTSNEIQLLQPGTGCDTIFLNSTGRTLDLVTAYITEESIWILVSSNRRQFLLEWIDRYIFPFDKVEIKDISNSYQILKILGSEQILKELGLLETIEGKYATHKKIDSVRVAIGTGLELPGYTLFIPPQDYSSYWERLINLGAIPLSESAEDQLRVKQGRPKPDQELTEEYNALEAGLWKAISFTKGCYIGQETIARLNTYKGVKQRLWGVKLSQAVPQNTPIYQQENKIGLLTSCVTTSEGVLGLGYIKTKAGGEGLTVKIGEAIGQIIAVSYLNHDYYEGKVNNS